jgi:hypothetical protein
MKLDQLKELVRQVVREEEDYQQLFKHMLDKSGKSIPSMSDDEKKKFFNAVDTAYKAKSEGRLRGYNEAELTGYSVVKESLIKEDIDTMYLVVALIAQLGVIGQLGFNHIGDYERRLGPIDSIKQWWKDKKDDKAVKSIIAKIKSDPEMIEFFKLSQNQQKGKFRKLIATKLSGDEIQYLNRINKSDLQENRWVALRNKK